MCAQRVKETGALRIDTTHTGGRRDVGGDVVDPNSLRCKFDGQAAGKMGHGGFRGTVNGKVRRGTMGFDRGEIHDAAPTATSAYMIQIGADQRIPATFIGIVERGTKGSTHHIDQTIEATPTLLRCRKQRFQYRPITCITNMGNGVGTACFQRGMNGLNRRRIPIDNGHLHAIGRQVQRHRFTQTTSPTGYHHNRTPKPCPFFPPVAKKPTSTLSNQATAGHSPRQCRPLSLFFT